MRHDHRWAPLEERPQGLVQHALELVEKGMLRRCEGHLDDGRIQMNDAKGHDADRGVYRSRLFSVSLE
jgi:hypothetical protein